MIVADSLCVTTDTSTTLELGLDAKGVDQHLLFLTADERTVLTADERTAFSIHE
jgi:hypothetical protein